MCGIIGILKNDTLETKELINHTLNSLSRLQNRGYDSCGIGLIADVPIVHKYASINTNNSLELLTEKLETLTEKTINNKYHIALGHNRWATHGPKTDENAHPHISYDNKFVVIHNGIIENYQELKESLRKTNPSIIYNSQTDTEVIAHLLSYHYTQQSSIQSIKSTIDILRGTYGLVIVNCDDPTRMYCVRNGSPLLVGKTDKLCMITSEQSGFNNQVNTYITLENDDICTISLTEKKAPTITTTNSYIENNITTQLSPKMTPEPYAHWTIKEIYEQPAAIQNSINMGGRIQTDSEVKLGGLDEKCKLLKLQNIRHIILLGCGSSYNAAQYGAYYFKMLCNFETVQVFDGAELSLLDLPKHKTQSNTQSSAYKNDELSIGFILISQSGETKDLYRCIELLKKYDESHSISQTTHIVTIGVVNVVDSLIAREVDCGVYCNSGQEIGVASTKSFTSQVVCLSLIALWFSQLHNINKKLRQKVITSLQNLSNDYTITLNQLSSKVQTIANTILDNTTNMFILGKGTDLCIANESSLKIKEISYIHTESYSASSLKHGPFALLDNKFPVILLNCQQEHHAKIINCYEEIKSRDSPIIYIYNTSNTSNPSNPSNPSNTSNPSNIKVTNNKYYGSLIALIPLQLLSYYLSINRNINPDKPKNLAKVVTVE